MWWPPSQDWYPSACFFTPYGPWDALGRTPYPSHNVYLYYQNLYGFNSPVLSQIQALINGWTGASPMKWLVSQGFPDLSNNCGWGETAWTESHASNSNTQIYYLLDLATGNVTTATAYDVDCAETTAGCYDNNPAHFHWVPLVRGLLEGEQYYWYQ
jgi:hypothetical protein